MIKAIAFDADNTLYNTERVARIADRKAMKVFAKQSKVSQKKLLKELYKIIAKVKRLKNPEKRFRNYSYKILAKKFGIKNYNHAYKRFYDVFTNDMLKHIKRELYVEEMLKEVKKRYKVAVFTEDPRLQTIAKLKKTGLKKYFKIIISSDETKIMKPSSKYYKLLQRKLKLKPKEILIVGDYYAKDIAPARKLGFTTVLYKDKNKADYCIRNHKELLRILKKL